MALLYVHYLDCSNCLVLTKAFLITIKFLFLVSIIIIIFQFKSHLSPVTCPIFKLILENVIDLLVKKKILWIDFGQQFPPLFVFCFSSYFSFFSNFFLHDPLLLLQGKDLLRYSFKKPLLNIHKIFCVVLFPYRLPF